MHNFTIGRQTGEHYALIFELNHHTFYFPIHIPCLQKKRTLTFILFIYLFMINLIYEKFDRIIPSSYYISMFSNDRHY